MVCRARLEEDVCAGGRKQPKIPVTQRGREGDDGQSGRQLFGIVMAGREKAGREEPGDRGGLELQTTASRYVPVPVPTPEAGARPTWAPAVDDTARLVLLRPPPPQLAP